MLSLRETRPHVQVQLCYPHSWKHTCNHLDDNNTQLSSLESPLNWGPLLALMTRSSAWSCERVIRGTRGTEALAGTSAGISQT